MNLRLAPFAITRMCNADHHVYKPLQRAHCWIQPDGAIYYRTEQDT